MNVSRSPLQFQIPVIQLTLDYAIAENEKRAAIAQVEENAAPDWRTYALATVKQVAERCAEFSTDKILEAMTDAPVWTHELRALGPIMLSAARAGFIVATDKFVTSDSISRHRSPKRVWKSNLYPRSLEQ